MAMSGFDDPGVFFSDNFGSEDPNTTQIQKSSLKKKFRDFLREFHVSASGAGGVQYIYRDELRRHYNLGQYFIEIDLGHLASYNDELADLIYQCPAEHIPLFEEAAKEMADEITRPRPVGEEDVHDIQILLKSSAHTVSVRNLKASMMAKLVKVPGITVSASTVRSKAIKIALQCRSCRNTIPNVPVKPGLEGYSMPRKCNNEAQGSVPCPLDPYFMLPDKCSCVDFQTLKLQEAPDAVPMGEMPRHLQLYVDRYLCDRMVPGNRVSVIGIYSIKRASKGVSSRSRKNKSGKEGVGIRAPYVRVLGVEVETGGPGRSLGVSYTAEDEEKIRRLASSPDIYERIAKSIAPSIFGSSDIKKSIACLLFGGSRKRLPDGLTRRGDINVLLLGDPGTAKSQLLKFVEQVSPIGVYTSGKGSSAAGLTAAVMRDPHSRNFIMEGGAMVLADGGVVCIDEFDKMREDDRVAIHEAMEQQTISIAKAGITTTLNSRCSVLAAANSVFGRWDDSKGAQNIDFMPTILSRFDMIFIVKDDHSVEKDISLAKHVMGVHMRSNVTSTSVNEGEIDVLTLTKYIAYCRSKCGPRLSQAACDKLQNRYVLMRSGAKSHENESHKKTSIPITVRQLEAIVRIAESLAKMKLQAFAGEHEIDEALRLFQVSTLDAAMTGDLSGVEGFTSTSDQEELNRIERQIKRRFAVGSQVSEFAIVQDFIKQKYDERKIYKVLHLMLRRGEVQHRVQRKMLYRIR